MISTSKPLSLLVATILLSACDERAGGDTSSGSGGDGGGTPGCTEGGVGSIAVETSGLPADAPISVMLTGPGGDRAFTANES
jgi:hypothetical protein